ncbi:MAG: PHP-associated domain-containing protein [Syntrophales bacterium]|nr:PHP-associated domain-containing protein [Syntrophales bacterium]
MSICLISYKAPAIRLEYDIIFFWGLKKEANPIRREEFYRPPLQGKKILANHSLEKCQVLLPEIPGNYGRADLHIHSSASDGIPHIPQILEYIELQTNLDIIAITDHDGIEGSHQAREILEKDKYRFEVVVGMEVSTQEGHLLALFLESPVPSFQPLASTLAAVHAQGGLCIAPHPMSRQRDSIQRHTIEKFLKGPGEGGVYLDGLEIINPYAASLLCSEDVRTLAKSHFHLAEIGGSDAHSLSLLGNRYTIFAGRKTEDLYRAILSRTTRAAGSSLDHHPSVAGGR